jgi:hypothetical protein
MKIIKRIKRVKYSNTNGQYSKVIFEPITKKQYLRFTKNEKNNK